MVFVPMYTECLFDGARPQLNNTETRIKLMSQKPNILFIMADQHRYDYLNCAGADFLRTPNTDRIAARGMRFTHAVTNCPVCAPA